MYIRLLHIISIIFRQFLFDIYIQLGRRRVLGSRYYYVVVPRDVHVDNEECPPRCIM